VSLQGKRGQIYFSHGEVDNMNADWDDAPSRVQRKAGNAIVWCVSLIFGVGITGGGLYLASGQIKPNPRSEAQVARLNAEAIRKHNEDALARQLANQQRYQPPPMQEKNWIRSSEEAQRDAQTQRELQEWSQARAQEQHDQQTSFSDATYVPQGARNVVPSTPIPREEYKPKPKKQEIVIVGKADPRLRDYCPYTKGSVEHRNCKMRMDLNSRNQGGIR